MYFDKKACRGSHSATIIEKYNLYINHVAVQCRVSHGVLGSALYHHGVQGGTGQCTSQVALCSLLYHHDIQGGNEKCTIPPWCTRWHWLLHYTNKVFQVSSDAPIIMKGVVVFGTYPMFCLYQSDMYPTSACTNLTCTHCLAVPI